jgi:hypothetical protein
VSDPGAALIKLHRPDIEPDFLQAGGPFSLPLPGIDTALTGQHYSIYDESFDAVVYRSKRLGLIVANNTYLSSFAYNLAIVWALYGHQHDQLLSDPDCALARLLRYNLKKFFAEQLLRRTDTAFARGIFLETLLFDERAMRPLFAQARTDTALAERFRFFSDLFSSLLLNHEIGHIVGDAVADFAGELANELGGNMAGDYEAPSGWAPAAQREFECDMFAVLMAWRGRDPSVEPRFLLRTIAFAFAVSACMINLDKSAEATAAAHPESAEPDLLDEIYAQLPGAAFTMGRDPFAGARAHAVARLCRRLAPSFSDPFASDQEFPFHPGLIEALAEFAAGVIDHQNVDERGLCELVARSLHGHPRGTRYLRLRSKMFTRGGVAMA